MRGVISSALCLPTLLRVTNCDITIIEEFEDTKGVIRIHISKKNRQHNDQKKKYKGQTTIYKAYI
jgi:hypothetical protein